MRCVVVDDEMPARDEIIYLLEEIGGVKILGEASNSVEALAAIKKYEPDVIFLDINMSGMDGFELVYEIMKLYHRPYIVFVTAYDQYAIKAFEVNAIDYILKPIDKKRLEKTIKRINNFLISNEANKDAGIEAKNKINKFLRDFKDSKKVKKICVYKNGKYIPLNPEDILFVTTVDRNTIIRSKIGEFCTNLTLSELEEKLSGYNFFRSHRSYLINLDEVKEIYNWFNGTFQVVLNHVDDVKVSVSRNKASEFKEIMNI
ncbi:MAG: two-component system, LytTR family, response regulator LytT [Candidatus Petromonas sp.]|jgi:DNA-binding LytR/AlgR family response regulator|nr:two-component system, LytTR family, response regulator LytT [Candidatus Petromonas sp.]